MPFKVHARTIFHLGADLISSDSIALYELVKNAFDAGSRDVEIACVIRIPSHRYFEHHTRLGQAAEAPKKAGAAAAIVQWKETIAHSIDSSAPGSPELRQEIADNETLTDLLATLEGANYIDVIDTGSGMTLDELESIYLSIGTPHRLREKERNATTKPRGRQILGDKGVGRLAVMRLGTRVRVETTTDGDTHWNTLDLDWNDFLVDPDASISDVDVEPKKGAKKEGKSEHGTRIHVTALTSAWSTAVVRELANEDIAKLGDPFAKARFPIVLSFNGEAVRIPRFESVLTDFAHAEVAAKFVANGADSLLEGTIDYRHRKRKRAFTVRGASLLSICNMESFGPLDALGSFEVKFFWFNRQAMRQLEGSQELRRALDLQTRWAGGLMVYRDGFRVNPYGTGDDDWLNLDRVALASSGYKVNRRQLVGKVAISSEANPRLIDQTNREGIRDSVERGVLIALLKHVVLGEFKPFLEQCDDEAKVGARLTVSDIETRVATERRRLKQIIKRLKQDYPKIAKETDIVSTLEEALGRLEHLMDQARLQVESYEEAQERVVHLAGTGLLVEMLAHELTRATRHTLSALAETKGETMSRDMAALLKTLEAQLRTLQKRLHILDPLGTANRQVKETFDLVQWVTEIVEAHKEQFRRHNIVAEITAQPPSAKGCNVKMVKGMLVQVLENLLSNSIYWLGQQAKLSTGFRGVIGVTVNTKKFTVSVSDNGPGIEVERRESVFEPFVTTKPAGEGKGLGLFISREIARYHKASLDLSDPPRADGLYSTFILDVSGSMDA